MDEFERHRFMDEFEKDQEFDDEPDHVLDVHGIVIKPNNNVSEVTLRTLPDYTAALEGGFLEGIAMKKGMMYVDEDALRKPYVISDVNKIATGLLHIIGSRQPSGWILGPVIVVGVPDRRGYDTNIDPDVYRIIRRLGNAIRSKNN